MEWILLLTLIVNGQPQTLTLRPFSEGFCNKMLEQLHKKYINIDENKADIVGGKCVHKDS